MKIYEIINEAVLDPGGWGETPYGTDIDYFGLRVQMKPSTFLKLALPLGSAETNPEVEKHMRGGGKIAHPMLDIEIPEDWEDGDYSKSAKVVDHEGRNRMKTWIKLKGDDPIQVNIRPRGWYRRKHLTPQHIEAISKGLIGQRGNLVMGPLFPTDTALEEDTVDEMALSTYKTMGDFTKQGPFTGADKKLVPHPKNIEKATRFFEQTPFDFRLFFSNIPGTGKWSEHGVVSPDQLRKIFGNDAEEIINGSEDAINIVFVGNKGDAKVMLTPWMMAHRFGHAIQASGQPLAKNKIASNWQVWIDTSSHFFTTVNNMLEEYYGKTNDAMRMTGIRDMPVYGLTAEYNALFNAIGTQRSSRSGQIRRPYEFLYELFAQYLGTGKITLNPLPANLTYGRKAWGNPTKYMNIKPEYRDESERKYAAELLERDTELMFNDVLSSSVGKIYLM